MFLAPVLLHRKFNNEKYYKHFVLPVQIINQCLKFENTEEDISRIEEGIVQWVLDYKK